MRTRQLFIACLSLLLLNACKKDSNPLYEYKELEMNVSSDAKAYVDTTDLGHSYFEKEVFESYLRGQLESRGSGFAFPTASDGSPLTFTNELTKETYGLYSVYSFMPKEDYDCIILYIHGGGYVYDMERVHIVTCDKLATELGAKVVVPQYPLAPENTFEEAHALMELIYKDLLSEGKRIIIMGDSAGGGFTVAFTQELKKKGLKLPDKLVLISPWLDITTSNPEIAEFDAKDAMLSAYGVSECGKMWAGNTDRTDYRLSPIYGDLEGLPDILLFVGDEEIMYPDNTKFAKMMKNKTNFTLVIGHGLFHTFPLFYFLPEAPESRAIIANFIN